MRAFVPSLTPRLWRLTGGSFLDTLGKGMTTPFLLIYLSEVRSLSIGVAGAVLAAFAGAGLVGTILGGSIADARGAQPTLIAGLLVTAAGTSVLAFATTTGVAASAMAVAGLGYGVARPAVSAFVVAVAERDQLHMAFSATRAANNLGLGLGALVAGLVAQVGNPTTFTVLILLDAATSVLFALVVLTLRSRARDEATASRESRPAGGYRRLFRQKAVLGVVGLNAALVLAGYAVFEAGLPLYSLREAGIDERGIGLVFVFNTIAVVIFQLPVARFLEGRDRLRYVAVAGVLWAAGWLAVLAAGESLHGRLALAAIAIVAVTFAIGECVLPVLSTLIAEIAPAEIRARALGLVPTSYGLGLTLGPALVGALLAVAPALLWIGAAAALGLIALAAVRLERSVPPEARVTPRPAHAP